MIYIYISFTSNDNSHHTIQARLSCTGIGSWRLIFNDNASANLYKTAIRNTIQYHIEPSNVMFLRDLTYRLEFKEEQHP